MTKKPRTRNAGTTVTLADVAREAGVSEITVSRVLRSKGPIAEKTREEVNAAARKVGYVLNRIAGSLATAGSELVGVIIPSLTNIVFPDVLRGLDAALSRRGYRTVLSVTGYQRDLEARLVASLLAWRPAALVVTGLEHDAETMAMLHAAGVTVVEVIDVDGQPVDIAVGMSHTRAGRETAVYLLQRGYRRFGYVGHDIGLDLRARKRHAAFLATLAEGGAQLLGESVAAEASSVAAGRAGLAELLRRHPEVEAVYFSNDDMAIGGMFHCLAEGVAVPGRLAIAGFNGLDLGQQLPQPLTTLRTHRFRMGQLAGEAILARLDGATAESIVDVGFELLPGATA